MARYFKLGPKASAYHDAALNLTIVNKQIVKFDGTLSKKSNTALGQGHIIEVTETDYNEANKVTVKKLKVVEPSTIEEDEEEQDEEDEDTSHMTPDEFQNFLEEKTRNELITWADENVKDLPGLDRVKLDSLKKAKLIPYLISMHNPE